MEDWLSTSNTIVLFFLLFLPKDWCFSHEIIIIFFALMPFSFMICDAIYEG